MFQSAFNAASLLTEFQPQFQTEHLGFNPLSTRPLFSQPKCPRNINSYKFQSAFNAASLLTTTQNFTHSKTKTFQSPFNAASLLTIRPTCGRMGTTQFQSAFNAASLLTVALIISTLA